jgi:hypothetical protein
MEQGFHGKMHGGLRANGKSPFGGKLPYFGAVIATRRLYFRRAPI